MLSAVWRNRAGYLILCIGIAGSLTAVHVVDQRDIERVCRQSQIDWQTWQRVIDNVRHPALAAGFKLTEQQTAALNRYADSISDSVGLRPHC